MRSAREEGNTKRDTAPRRGTRKKRSTKRRNVCVWANKKIVLGEISCSGGGGGKHSKFKVKIHENKTLLNPKRHHTVRPLCQAWNRRGRNVVWSCNHHVDPQKIRLNMVGMVFREGFGYCRGGGGRDKLTDSTGVQAMIHWSHWEKSRVQNKKKNTQTKHQNNTLEKRESWQGKDHCLGVRFTMGETKYRNPKIQKGQRSYHCPTSPPNIGGIVAHLHWWGNNKKKG